MRRRNMLVSSGLAALWIVLLPAPVACGDDPDPGPELAVTIDEIHESPEDYLGEEVTVTAEVAEVLGERGFEVSEGVLVVTVGGLNDSELASGHPIAIRGTVREFDLAEIEQEIDYDLPDDQYEGYGGFPVLVASNFEVYEEGQEFPDPGEIEDQFQNE